MLSNEFTDRFLCGKNSEEANAVIFATEDGDYKLSYKKFYSLAQDLSQKHPFSELNPGETVCTLMWNTLEYLVVFFATLMRSCSVSPLNPVYSAKEILFYLNSVKPRFLFVSNEEKIINNSKEALKDYHESMSVVKICANMSTMFISVNEIISNTKINSHEPNDIKDINIALILYTSGTTGRQKGVPIRNSNIISSVENIVRFYNICPSDVSYLVMPLFHVHGIIGVLLTSLFAGASVVIRKKFSVTCFWDDILRLNCTWYSAVPTINIYLLGKHNDIYNGTSGKLRFIRCSSSPLFKKTMEEMEEKYKVPVLQAYSSSEAAHQITSNPLPESGISKPGSVGISSGVEVSIRDEIKSLPCGTPGEVCIRGPSVFSGYLNTKITTDHFFPGGWFRTGDWGYTDSDNYVFLTSRIKEQINRGGEKISPVEIDETIMEHGGLKMATTFAVPSERYGEDIETAIEIDPNYKDQITEEKLLEFMASRLANFKIPRKIHIVESMPLSATGKPIRGKVAEYIASLRQ